MMVNEFNLTYQHHETQYPSHGFNDYIIIIIIIIITTTTTTIIIIIVFVVIVVASSQAQLKQMNPLTCLVQYKL
jgi:hypothetical protein